MSELSARLGLYVAIDDAASESDDQLQAAAAVIPVYRLNLEPRRVRGDRLGTLGWNDEREVFLPEVEIKTVDSSLQELAELADVSELDQARRLKAVWAVARVVPDLDRKQRDLLAAAVRPLVAGARGDAESVDPERRRGSGSPTSSTSSSSPWFATAEKWDGVVQAAEEQGLVSSQVAMLAHVGCEDWVTLVPVEVADGTDIDPAARIVSTVKGFDVGTRTLGKVRTLLEPTNWPTCLKSFWCSMNAVTASGVSTTPIKFYQERVGDCPTVWFEPYLRFASRDLRGANNKVNGFELQYDLALASDLKALSAKPSKKLTQDGRVEVDRGLIKVVIRHPPGAPTGQNQVDITTSKSIRFREPLPTGAVALLACVSGWADMTRTMMAGCLGTAP